MRGNGCESSEIPNGQEREYIARWIAKGYKQAEKRYGNHGPYNIVERLFKPIEKAADKALTYAEEYMVLTVRVDFKNLETFIDCDYPAEDEDNY